MSQPERPDQPPIHEAEWWDSFEAHLDEQRGPLNGMQLEGPDAEKLVAVIKYQQEHIDILHFVLRSVALNSHAKRTHAPKKQRAAGEP